ncbi:MAG: PIG-L family deacetylase [Planctomycetales bacterium]|nr:PIG-L family deacetylase [Planctomycetales bacterium]
MISEFRNALIVAAHPDDEVLGVGGTIPRLKSLGARVTVLIVTDGSTAQYPDDSETLQRKIQQARDANEVLGVDQLVQWDCPDMRLDQVDHCLLNERLSSFIGEGGFDVVFCQNGDDVNLDHQVLHRSVLVATRPFPGQPVKAVLSYWVNSSTEWGGRSQATVFCPNLYVDIAETVERKLAAMERYVDELRDYPHPRSLQAIRLRAAVTGNEVGIEFAEAFKVLLCRV